MTSGLGLDVGAGAGCLAEFGPSRELCGGEVVVWLVAGCIHEHLLLAETCQYHVQGLAEQETCCGPCADVGEHDCPVAVLGELGEDGEMVVLRG
ncbi:hypothetical protein [Nonomuraea sp. NPDC005650]|uniref:hypothetical protein n=1 Tax=Nonomuraea sp. NPDC005650 TaxID=3157045 RepID=UPI0033AD3CE3